jgi:putative salt-induced outer membrane protein YdiY
MKRSCFAIAVAVPVFCGAARADTVELVSGDILHGTVAEQSESLVIIEHPLLGRVELPADQVKSVRVGEPDTAEQDAADVLAEPAAAVAETEAVAAPHPLSQTLLPGWDKHLEVGFTGTDGNTQTTTIKAGFAALRENDEERTKIALSTFYNKDDGERNRNEASGEVVQDWLMPGSPWFKFATAKLEYDEFKDWETRASAFAGVGKQIFEGPKNELIGRAGLGGSYEFDAINEIVPEALLGLEWVHHIHERQTLTGYVTVYPDLDEFGESRTLAGGAWTIKIDEADGLSLKLGIENEYESRTESTAKHNDVKYYGALVFDF